MARPGIEPIIPLYMLLIGLENDVHIASSRRLTLITTRNHSSTQSTTPHYKWRCKKKDLRRYHSNRPYPGIWKTVPIRINILKLHHVNFCIENKTLSKFQGDTRNDFPDIAFRIYINLIPMKSLEFVPG